MQSIGCANFFLIFLNFYSVASWRYPVNRKSPLAVDDAKGLNLSGSYSDMEGTGSIAGLLDKYQHKPENKTAMTSWAFSGNLVFFTLIYFMDLDIYFFSRTSNTASAITLPSAFLLVISTAAVAFLRNA